MDIIDDEIVNLGTISQRQAARLILQSISAPTTTEKDKLIHEAKEAYKTHMQCMDQVNSWNQAMAETLAAFEEKVSIRTNEFRTLSTNTAFQKELRKHAPTENDRLKAITAVKDIEAEIQKLGPLASQSVVDDITETNFFSMLKLRDITFKRLEELSYSMKKRSFIVDESEDVSLQITNEYGSLQGLLDIHEKLSQENQVLRSEELSLMSDSLVKRRSTSLISLSWLSNIILSLQTELSAQKQVGSTLLIQPESTKSPNEMSLDDLFPANQEITFSKSEFPTIIDQETIEKLVNSTTTDEKIESLKEIIKLQEQMIDHLYEELEPLRLIKYQDNEAFLTQERENRLWALNDKFQNQIFELQEKITMSNEESSNLYRNIMMMINQRKYYGELESEIIHHCKSLLNDDAFLHGIVSQNEQVCQSLSSISKAYGLSLMNNQNEDMDNYLKSEFKDILGSYVDTAYESSRVPSPHNEEEESEQMKMMKHMRKRSLLFNKEKKGLSKKGRRHTTFDKKIVAETSRTQTDRTSTITLSHNPIEKASRSQLFNYLSLIADIDSSIKGPQTAYHHDISGRLHLILGDLRSNVYVNMHDSEELIRRQLNAISISSDQILRIPKVDIETTADTEPKFDMEVQTEEEEKKGKVKPPAKDKTKATGRKLKK